MNGANGVHKRGAQTVLKAGKEAGKKYGRTAAGDLKTDYTRWRLRDDRGVQTWHYLESEEEVKAWPQSTADKWYLGLDTVSYASHMLQQLQASIHAHIIVHC